MPHVIEPATSGRAKCRGCDQRIAKGELRLGERLPNPYAEGEMTHWYHPTCAAFKRPQALLDVIDTPGTPAELRDDTEQLRTHAQHYVAHRRLSRIDGAERASTGRARCRSCRELIAKGDWRIRLVFYEEGRFQPSGFVHAQCSGEYFETTDVVDAASHFSSQLAADDLEAFRAELKKAADAPD